MSKILTKADLVAARDDFVRRCAVNKKSAQYREAEANAKKLTAGIQLKNPVGKIACAAVRDGKKKRIFYGARHDNCLLNIYVAHSEEDTAATFPPSGQGFVLDTGAFVSRKQAGPIALKHNQITALGYDFNNNYGNDFYQERLKISIKNAKTGEEMRSEDLW